MRTIIIFLVFILFGNIQCEHKNKMPKRIEIRYDQYSAYKRSKKCLVKLSTEIEINFFMKKFESKKIKTSKFVGEYQISLIYRDTTFMFDGVQDYVKDSNGGITYKINDDQWIDYIYKLCPL